MKLALALLVATGVVVVAALDWRRAVKAALVLVVLEGAIRKWLLPQASDLVYFLKDIVLLGAYVRFYALEGGGATLAAGRAGVGGGGQGRRPMPVAGVGGLKGLLVLAAGLIGLQALNVRQGSVLVGAFGVKAYLWYVPLCFLLRDLFRTPGELLSFLRGYVLLAVPVCLLGAAQFEAPIHSPLNTYVATGDVSGFGEENRARITGTFSYISGHATYLTVCLALVAPLLVGGAACSVRAGATGKIPVPLRRRAGKRPVPLAMPAARRRGLPAWGWRLIWTGAAVLLVGNMFMTGSRGPVLAAVLFGAGFLVLAWLGRRPAEASSLGALVFAGVVCALASAYAFEDAWQAFWQRATGSEEELKRRISGGFFEAFGVVSVAGLTGFGTGSTHPGSAGLRQRLGLEAPPVPAPEAEIEGTRVMLELGLAGFVLWYAVRLYLLWALWRTWRRLRLPLLRHLALAGFLIHAIHLQAPVVVNHTFGVYYWFFAGFIFLLPKLEAAGGLVPRAPQVRTSWRRSVRRSPGKAALVHSST
jgi:hypothetical protein